MDEPEASEIVYLLHLDSPLKHARHYLGTTTNLEKRLKKHGTKDGAKMLLVARQSGISWQLVRVWNGGRELEKRLKQHSSTRNCPICTPPKRGRKECTDDTSSSTSHADQHAAIIDVVI